MGALANFTHSRGMFKMRVVVVVLVVDHKGRMEGVSVTYQSGDLGTDHDVDPLVDWGDKGDKLREVRRSTRVSS